MFIENKYYNWYKQLMNSRKLIQRNKSKLNYYELHHIIPKSLGGSDDIGFDFIPSTSY